MSHYEKSVLDLLKDGPKQRNWIGLQLCPKVMSQKKLQNTVNDLETAGKIKGVAKRVEGRRNWAVWYMLPEQEYLLDVDAGRIIAAIDRLKSILMRMPLVDELAIEAGITPSEAEKLAYKLATQTGWYNPTPELVQDAKVKLGEALVGAARIKAGFIAEDGTCKDFDYRHDAHIIELAKRYLKEYPNLLPKLSDDGDDVISWPQEALRFLRENYEPEARKYAYGSVVVPGRPDIVY